MGSKDPVSDQDRALLLSASEAFIWTGHLFLIRVHNGYYSMGMLGTGNRIYHHSSGPESSVVAATRNAYDHVPAGCTCVTNSSAAFNALVTRPSHRIPLSEQETAGETADDSQGDTVLVAYALRIMDRYPHMVGASLTGMLEAEHC